MTHPSMAAVRQPGSAAATRDPQARSVLIGLQTFQRLQVLQKNILPSPPRLDMRYLLDGALTLIAEQRQTLRAAWLDKSTELMLVEARRTRAEAKQEASGLSREQDRQGTVNWRTSDCRSLQIGEATFQALKAMQDQTEPRLGIRYLAEGAFELLMQRHADVLVQWTHHSREALRQHLEGLRDSHLISEN